MDGVLGTRDTGTCFLAVLLFLPNIYNMDLYSPQFECQLSVMLELPCSLISHDIAIRGTFWLISLYTPAFVRSAKTCYTAGLA